MPASTRDAEITRLLAAGLTNDQIAERVGCSERTVRRVREAIRRAAHAPPPAESAVIRVEAFITPNGSRHTSLPAGHTVTGARVLPAP